MLCNMHNMQDAKQVYEAKAYNKSISVRIYRSIASYVAVESEAHVFFHIKGKKLSDTCYGAFYMRRTRDQKRFYNLGSGSCSA